MFSSQAAEISLNISCRTLAAVPPVNDGNDDADNGQVFLVGTCSVQQPNHVHAISYQHQSNELVLEASYAHHDGPVRCLATIDGDDAARRFLTVAERSSQTVLWQRHDDDDAVISLETVTTFVPVDDASPVVDLCWRRHDDDNDNADTAASLLTLSQQGTVTLWNAEVAEAVQSQSYNNATSTMPGRVQWDPHSNGQSAAVALGKAVHLIDWRENSAGGIVASDQATTTNSRICHASQISDLDYNPHKPFTMATAGHDGASYVWDLRQLHRPLLTARGGHSFWVHNIAYNPFHDQLVLTGGCDSVVCLWNWSSVSSAPLMLYKDDLGSGAAAAAAAPAAPPTTSHNENDDADPSHFASTTTTATNTADQPAPDIMIERIEQHQEAVYATAWGTQDAWIYATLGYDGKLMLHHVPSTEKYKILL